MTLPEGFIVVGPDATREECIAAWVKNLRNPNVRQARGRLISSKGAMCCLGVAAVTLGRKVNESESVLKSKDMSRFGLRTDNGQLTDASICLSGRNDRGATFSEIADLIESCPPGLFVESST